MKKCVILTILICSGFSLKAQELVYQENVDLNSDGKIEHVKLEIIQNTANHFILKIDDKQYRDSIDEERSDGFQIIDINRYDKYKEVVVHAPGSSDLDENIVYWYDGENIKKMDKWIRMPTILGNGIVYRDAWEGFWTSRDKWVLDDISRNLSLVPQFAHYVGVKIKVVETFPIYRNKDLKDTVAFLSKDSEIELLLCDKRKAKRSTEYLYLIKSSSGLIGWAIFDEIHKNSTGFLWAG